MTKNEQAKLAVVASDVSWLKLKFSEKETSDAKWQEKIDKHLETLNSNVNINTYTLFGKDGDSGLAKRVCDLTNKWWLLALALVGSGGLGAGASQWIETLIKSGG